MLSETPPAIAKIALVQPQLLGTLNQTGITSGTGGADRVVRTGDPHVQGDFTSRIVGDRSRIVVMRPEFGVVIKIADLVDFVFGFDVAVLGHADVDTDAIVVDVGPVHTGTGNGFIGTVHADTAGPGAAAGVLAGLVTLHIKVANAGKCLAKITNLVIANAADPRQQRSRGNRPGNCRWGRSIQCR